MLDQLPLPEVIAACRFQTERFQRGAASDSRFCLELWRRAIDSHDSQAWHGILDQYRPLVRERLRRSGLDDAAVEEVVHQTFINLWLKSRSGAFSTGGRTLPEVLQYFLNSARYALIALRRQRLELPLPENSDRAALIGEDTTALVDLRIDARVVLAHIRSELKPEEWQAVQLRYAQALPPREIAVILGTSVEHVYGMLAEVKRRMRNRPDLRELLD